MPARHPLGYSVKICGAGAAVAARLAARAAGEAFVVFDRRVRARAAAIVRRLKAAGVRVLGTLSLEGGERLKSLHAVERIYAGLLAARAGRRTLLVAVGGGTLTDTAGFAAATFLRGVPWLPVATTVLGMLDAAIGGKTGVDLAQGKNLAGAFWDPIGVVADLDAIATLPPAQRRTGMAEAIKCAVIARPRLLAACATFDLRSPPAAWRRIVATAAAVKIALVSRDPRERGARAALNLGHTIGHAIESSGGYRLRHGEAVAVGLRAAGLLALRNGMFSNREHARVLRALAAVGLPLHATVDAGRTLRALAHDKKRIAGTPRFVLPARIGHVVVGVKVGEADIRRTIETCRTPPGAAELGA